MVLQPFARIHTVKFVITRAIVSPNLSRLLDRWGLDSTIRELGCTLESVDVRRWKDGSILSSVPMMPGIGTDFIRLHDVASS